MMNMPMGPMDPNMPIGGAESATCPCCGQPLPQPFNSGQAPNVPMPPGAYEPGQQGGDQSQLLAMLMGGS